MIELVAELMQPFPKPYPILHIKHTTKKMYLPAPAGGIKLAYPKIIIEIVCIMTPVCSVIFLPHLLSITVK